MILRSLIAAKLWLLLLLLLLLLSFFCFFRRACCITDAEALLAFKAQVTKDPSNILAGWGFPVPANPCTWSGITCNQANRVIKLRLANAQLLGTLPVSAISSMDMLQSLDLSQNGFSGNISGLLSGYGGQFQQLLLSANNFTGELPTDLLCDGLQVLDLSRNRLTGLIPSAIESCSSLRLLNLSFNQFTGYLPESLGNLQSIEKLYLSNNKFVGPISVKFTGICSTVQELDLSVNNLSGNIHPSFASCSYLAKLNLAENNLSGDFPAQILSDLSSLESLLLAFNSFTGPYPVAMNNCSFLKILDLSSNKLSGTLPARICPPGFALEKLYLPNNDFVGEIPAAVSNCSNLKVLDLSFNHLEGTIPADLGLLSNLETLALWFNGLSGAIPSELGNLSKLKNLVLNHNYLSGSIPVEIMNCTLLEWISLTSNRLTGRIPEEIGNLKMLTLLMLANNSLSGELPWQLGNCTNLLWLDVNTNDLSGQIPPRLGRLASGPPEVRTLGGNVFAFVRNVGSSCKGIGIGTLVEFRGISQAALWKTPVRQFCESTRLYIGDSLNDNPDFSSIQVIDLAYNRLEGNIPAEIGFSRALTMLDLAHNQLTGPIPATFASLRNLGVLDLSHNRLHGSLLPLGNCSFLVQIDVSNNNFTGSIPTTGQLSTAPPQVYANNPFLCGEPLAPCGQLSRDFVSCGSSCGHRQVTKLSWGYSLMLAILVCIICVCIFIAWLMFKRVRKKRKDSALLSSLQSSCNGTSGSWNFSGEKEPLSINVATFERPLRKLTFSQLIEATNGFSEDSLIGSGGFGEVYKAELKDGKIVAIKKLLQFSFQGDREFMAEMETLGKIKHRNLVPLLGYCKIGEERLLVYEYMHCGSIDEVLHGRREIEMLSWDQRKQIAKGAARGLSFLHHNCIPHIIHRDMKSSNVLLDKDLEAHVSDFGMARLINAFDTHLSVSTLAGTPGYVPPEYYQSFRCTTKGDVYSFGVILLELLTGKRPTNKEEFEDSNLVGWVKQHMNQKRSVEVLDSELRGTGAENEMMQCLTIACECLEDHPSRRPTMLEVVAMLKDLGGEQEE